MWPFNRIAWAIAAWLFAAPLVAQEIVITFGGDVNFARSRQAPSPEVVRKFRTHRLEATTRLLAGEWDGDINFINVETVVAERDGARQGKTFVFRSHPDQFTHLMDLGVNAFALANNHAYDHGWPGLEQTRAFFERSDRADRPLLFAGTGTTETVFAPDLIEVKGIRVAMSAISFGNGAFSPTEDRVGMAYLFHRDHYQQVLNGLRDIDADLKLLSIHYGTENFTGLNGGQATLFRRAVVEAGVHLVLGHHPHVVRGVEVMPRDDAAIFYSLGNLLFIGGAEKDSSSLGSDYGLLGKAYFSFVKGRPQLDALEAVPLKGVHLIPRRPPPGRARATIEHLNGLSRRSVGATAASFSVIEPDEPRGLACFGGPYGPRAQERCCTVERSKFCDYPDLM